MAQALSPVVIAVSNLGVSSTLVLAAGTVFSKLTFINPNVTAGAGVAIAICPTLDINNNPVTASYGGSGAGAGNIPLLPGASFDIIGAPQGSKLNSAWAAAAASGAGNNLTILCYPPLSQG